MTWQSAPVTVGPVLGYLPQHVAQVAGVALGICLVAFGALALGKGVPPELAGRLSPRLVRMLAPLAILLGIAVGSAFVFVDAEGPNRPDGNDWGGVWGVVVLLVWLAFLGGITVYNLRRYKEAERRSRKRE